MSTLILILVIVALIFYIATQKKKTNDEETTTETPKAIKKEPAELPYQKKKLFTRTEYIFYKILKEKCDAKNLTIYPKTRMEDYIEVINTKEIMKYRGYIKSRHIDFIIVNENYELLAGIELDDKTHESEKAKKTDNFKDEVFKKIGLPLFRIKTGANYNESIDTILKELAP